jgi:pimeloyl-ACP methyl ester carboxylesterase
MEPTLRRVAAADGLELALYEWSADGVPLLMLHGFGNDAHVWEDLAPLLAPHYRTLALDLRGHGESSSDPEGRYDHLSMARDVAAVCDALAIRRVVIVGHSLGGRVAMRFAGLEPQRLAGLVLVDTAPDLDLRGVTRIRVESEQGPPTFASLRAYEDLLAQHYPATRPERLRGLARHWTRQRPDGRFEPKLDAKFRMRRAGATAEDMERYMREEAEALWKALRELPCPALVVRGAASDVISQEVAEQMVEDVIPDARLAIVDRAGHSVMLDNPDGFNAAVVEFALG